MPGFFFPDKVCDALRDLVAFAQFKNRKNIHGGVLLLAKMQASVTLLHGCFSSFESY